MPFGFFEKNDKEAELARNASLEALQRGDITPGARRRLAAFSQSQDKVFASTLGAGATLLARQAGFEPLTQVMGSAFVKLDWEEFKDEYFNFTGEVVLLTQRHGLVRELALSRMMREATLLGADGVVGVKLVGRSFDWGGGIWEFTASGTAIKVNHKPDLAEVKQVAAVTSPRKSFFSKGVGAPITSVAGQGMVVGHSAALDVGHGKPFLSNLSGQQFWQLYQAGYWPRAIVSGNQSYYVQGDDQTRKAQSGLVGSLFNQELVSFSKGISFCRLRAMDRLKKEVKACGGEGVVGVELDNEIEGVTFKGEPHFIRGVIITFNVLGTAVVSCTPPPGAGNATGSRLVVDLCGGASSIGGIL